MTVSAAAPDGVVGSLDGRAGIIRLRILRARHVIPKGIIIRLRGQARLRERNVINYRAGDSGFIRRPSPAGIGWA